MKKIHLAYDSREQLPLHVWEKHCSTWIEWHKASLQTFDYCVWQDWEEREGRLVRPYFAIERKSVEDFIGSWFNKERRENEVKKIKRAERWSPRPIIYVVDGGMEHVGSYDYGRFMSGSVTKQSVESHIDKLRYAGVQVILAGSRLKAEYVIISILKRRIHDKSARHWKSIWTLPNGNKEEK